MVNPSGEFKAATGRDSPPSTLYSLRTASSDTVRFEGNESDIQSHSELSREEFRKICPAEVENTLSCIQRRPLATDIAILKSILRPLIELSKIERYRLSVHKRAVSLILLHLGVYAEVLVHVLVALPQEDAQQFFDDLTPEEKASWTASWRDGFWKALVFAVSGRHLSLDSLHMLALPTVYDRRTFTLLFSAGNNHPISESRNIDLLFTYIEATYSDRHPQLFSGVLQPQDSDLTLHAIAIYLDRCPGSAFSAFLARLLGRMKPDTYYILPARDIGALLSAAPYLESSLSTPTLQSRRCSNEQHPASPFLYCALRLASWSSRVRMSLVEHGLLVAAEGLYDEDKPVVHTDHGTRSVSGTSRHIMIQLCYLLLGVVARCCDLSGSTLVEELRADIIAFSRMISRRYFAPEPWEICDD